MPYVRYVVDSAIGPDDASFAESFHGLVDALDARGFDFEMPVTEESDGETMQRNVVQGGRGCIVVYDDHDTGVRYVLLSLLADDDFEVVFREMLARLPIQLHSDLVAAFTATPSPQLLVKLAISSPEPASEQVASIVESALEHDDAMMRRRAAQCVFLLGEERFLPALRLRAKLETDARVTEAIERVLDDF